VLGAQTAKMRAFLAVLVVAVVPSLVGTSHACVGDGCLNIYATANGALTTTWDFENRPVPTYCVSTRLCTDEACLYNAIDPGFIHGPAPAPGGLATVENGTRISLEVVARDAAVTFRLNNEPLDAGETGLLGTAPDLHNHPGWQLTVPNEVGVQYPLSFRLVTDSPAYEDSETFTILLEVAQFCTGDPTATPSPTATRTPGGPVCPGDCNGDDTVTVDEVVEVVGVVLGESAACGAMDFDDDGVVSVSDAVATVHSALYGCESPPPPATLAFIQDTIFTPRCAVALCHNAQSGSGDLTLEAGSSYGELVDVEPDIDVVREAGFLRVDPGDPENSFLLVKLQDPPPAYGSPMPLLGDPLTADEIALIRAWIADGAEP